MFMLTFCQGSSMMTLSGNSLHRISKTSHIFWVHLILICFASRTNYQIKPLVSWQPDPESCAIDAYTIKWDKGLNYAFPPLSQIKRVVNKVARDKADELLIVPN